MCGNLSSVHKFRWCFEFHFDALIGHYYSGFLFRNVNVKGRIELGSFEESVPDPAPAIARVFMVVNTIDITTNLTVISPGGWTNDAPLI